MKVSMFDLLFENILLTEPYSVQQISFSVQILNGWGGGLGGGANNFLLSYIILNVNNIKF